MEKGGGLILAHDNNFSGCDWSEFFSFLYFWILNLCLYADWRKGREVCALMCKIDEFGIINFVILILVLWQNMNILKLYMCECDLFSFLAECHSERTLLSF